MIRTPDPCVTAPPASYDLEGDVVILGAGACGLVAALAAQESGRDVLVIEADPVPRGSTALSAGLIPAAGTRIQQAAGISDTPEIFAQDIQNKAKNENDPDFVDLLTRNAAPVIDWLSAQHGLDFSLVTDFDYPGHSHNRMHGLASRSGLELIDALRSACETQGIDIICERRAFAVHQNDHGHVTGLSVACPDGRVETISSSRLILACNGYGGNRALVTDLMPQIDNAIWFGHDGNRGEAVLWGRALKADLGHLGAYQGHGNVAHPHGILISWATITSGGVQVNKHGHRFWNEAQGYSEAARAVLSQPDGAAYAIFDARIASIARQFEDFKQAEAAGAIETANTAEDLASKLGLPAETLTKTLKNIPESGIDEFGRHFETPALEAPFCGVRVTGALFHTLGGLRVNAQAKVLRDGEPIQGLYAGGGAACGVSGSADSGYLSGNGLLSAVVLGFLAGNAP